MMFDTKELSPAQAHFIQTLQKMFKDLKQLRDFEYEHQDEIPPLFTEVVNLSSADPVKKGAPTFEQMKSLMMTLCPHRIFTGINKIGTLMIYFKVAATRREVMYNF